MNAKLKPEPSFPFFFSPDIVLPILSGLLLTGSFPKVGMDGLAWFALVPLLISLRNLSLKESFRAGFLAGICHYLTLAYWLAYTMKTYGGLPLILSVPILFLLCAYLALYTAVFSMGLNRLCSKPAICLFMIPVLWVSLEYIRSFFLSGFPWELLGYSQFGNLNLIQISDIFGVYGVSFLIALSNGAIFLVFLCWKGKDWQGTPTSKPLAAGAMATFILLFSLIWFYGKWRVLSVDELASASPSARVTVVQGNIEQTKKWDAAFRYATTKKYLDLSFSAKAQKPDIIVWPETAAPFYFLHNERMTEIVLKGIRETDTNFLIGSPSVTRGENGPEYHNSAYLIRPDGTVSDKYDKAHLVPFGEYVPLKRWLPFLGKIVEHVGDFTPGTEGKTIQLGNYSLGVQICYEIIFSNLSRKMARNNANLLINITNDAWYGTTSAPYQHFSMTVFRAVENRRSLVRSANTGISGFIDPVGRVIAQTHLFQDAVVTRSVPVLSEKTLYTQFGDFFAVACLSVALIILLMRICMRRIQK